MSPTAGPHRGDRLRRGIALTAAAALAGLLAPSPTLAQDEPAVRLTLLGQAPVVAEDRPFSIRVGAVNETDTAFESLTVSIGIYSPARSRSEYGEAMESGPVSPLVVRTFPIEGTLPPGAGRAFPTMELPRTREITEAVDNALYPVSVELRSSNLPVATIRSSVVGIVERPVLALNVSVSLVLDEPVRTRPDGTFLDDVLERSSAPGGRLDAIVSAVEGSTASVTLVVSPVVLESLRRMTGGYRVAEPDGSTREVPPDDPRSERAGALVRRIAEIGRRPTTEVVALPYASPSAPALASAGLFDDLRAQIERGHAVVADILGVQPSTTVFRPPGSALSSDALEALGLQGVGALLVDSDVLPPPAGLTLSPPALAQVGAGDAEPLTAITADPGVDARIQQLPDQPRLRAQWVLGELSALYFEEPSVVRGVALVIGEDDHPETAFLKALLRGLTVHPSVRWLRGVKATSLLFGTEEEAPDRRRLAEASRATVSLSFELRLRDAKADVAHLASMADQPQILDGLRRMILLSESRYYLGREDLGLAFLDAASDGASSELAKVQPPEASSITLTSRRGTIPLTLRNDAGYPVQVHLILRSPRLRFLEGSTRDLTLSEPVQVLPVEVRAQTTGRFPVRVVLQTPDGHSFGSSTILVRSTAYNRVALVITVGAALFLALWWGRRLLPRRRTG